MNERIKELIRQAESTANEGIGFDGQEYTDILMEKFAELIVKECVQVTLETIYNNGIGNSEDCLIVGNTVAEHFGVEE